MFISLQDALNKVVLGDLRSNKDNITQAVLAVHLQMKESEFLLALKVSVFLWSDDMKDLSNMSKINLAGMCLKSIKCLLVQDSHI